MRKAELIAAGQGFKIRKVTCEDDHKGWSRPEPRTGYGFVLARRGTFNWESNGQKVKVDRTVGYVTVPGAEERFAHPTGGDVCTSIEISPDLWRSPPTPALYVNARLDLAHRRLLNATNDVDYAVAEELLRLLDLTHKPALTQDQDMVEQAREAIHVEDPGGLLQLASKLGVSPYRLSRAFPRELGVTLTQYRNRVRVGKALDRLEQGERDLAGLAADLGFADQSHLCRVVQAQLGRTPTMLRRLLQGCPRPGEALSSDSAI